MKVYTCNCIYSKNPVMLLSKLLQQSGGVKTIVTYGNNATFKPLKNTIFAVINITRYQNEYCGFLNKYKR